MTGPRPLEIALVGINYSPEHAGIAPYVSAAAEALGAEGHQVTVLTGVPHYPSWTVPPGYRRSLRRTETVNGVVVHRLRHYVPASQDALRRGLYELTFALHVRGRLARCPRPDVVVAVVPSLLSAVVAAAWARRTGARLVVWLQDSMAAAAEQSGMSGGTRVASLVRRAEHRVLRSADQVIVVSGAFGAHVLNSGVDGATVHEIKNWTHVGTPTSDSALMRQRCGWSATETVVLHTGNMGLKQDLHRVVEAAGIGGDGGTLRYVLMGDGSQRAALQEVAAGVDGVDILPPVDESSYPDVLAAADILLVNERAGVVDMSLPSKLTSYLAAGRPVIAVVDPAGGTASLIRSSGAGVIAAEQTAAGLAVAVRTLRDDVGLRQRLGGNGRRYAAAQLSSDGSLRRLVDVVVGPGHASQTRVSSATGANR